MKEQRNEEGKTSSLSRNTAYLCGVGTTAHPLPSSSNPGPLRVVVVSASTRSVVVASFNGVENADASLHQHSGPNRSQTRHPPKRVRERHGEKFSHPSPSR